MDRKIRTLKLAAAALLLFLTLAPAAAPATAHATADDAAAGQSIATDPDRPVPQLVFLSWDGAPDRVVDRLIAEGKMPNLAALAARGARAAYSVTSFPSKTAAAHAALWTGCGPGCNGIVANSVPRIDGRDGQGTLLQGRSGFSSEALTAEPLYVTAARAGRTVLVLSATQSYPEGPHVAALAKAGVPAERYRSFSGFEHEIERDTVHGPGAFAPLAAASAWPGVAAERLAGAREAEFAVGDTRVHALLFDDPDDPVAGFDSLLLRLGSRAADAASDLLKPRPAVDGLPAAGTLLPGQGGWSRAFAVRRGDRTGNTFYRLFELAPDGSRLVLYQRKASALKGAATAAEIAEYTAAYAGFHDEPIYSYESGFFGAPLMAGGDGSAEQRALELVAFDVEQVIAGTRFAIDHWRPDLLFHYSPMADQAGHVWTAVLDPALAWHDPQLAARVRPYYERVFTLLDRWLGAIVAQVGPGRIVALASDHGMAGVSHDFYANNALEAAGLLTRDAAGGIDLAKTQVLMPAFGDFSVNVARRDRWAAGAVPAATAEQESPELLRRAAAALLAVRDPETGAAVVERVFRPQEIPGLELDPNPAGQRTGDLYFDLAPGYYARHGFGPAAVALSRTAWGGGEHGFWPERRDMHAIFYLAGAGVAPGVETPGVRHIDVAPTLSRLLGIPAPADATGRVIAEALAEP
jgi:predicted AlkP superfamily pyrophosphatase or phosphodiesterase